MLRSIFLSSDHAELVLDNFYKFPRPEESALKKREKLVKQIIDNMGHKYRLSRSMQIVKA